MPVESATIWTIVVAAGSGSRFGGEVPKQFLVVSGQRIVDWSIWAAASVSRGVVVVVPPASSVDMPNTVGACEVVRVEGGNSRSESVRNGLTAVPPDADVVLVHDAARPIASVALFRRVVEAITNGADGAVPVVPVVDTIRQLDGTPIDRASLEAVQTPQGFAADVLRSAHAAGTEATDDASLVAAAGGTVVGVEGERWNLKITEPEDHTVVAALLEANSQERDSETQR